MNRLSHLAARLRASRPATAASIGAVALVLSVGAPSVLSALGSLSGPVGCQSSPDFSDDLTDDLSVGLPGVSGDLSDDPCILGPGVDDSGGDDGGSGGVPVSGDLDGTVVSGTPTFTG